MSPQILFFWMFGGCDAAQKKKKCVLTRLKIRGELAQYTRHVYACIHLHLVVFTDIYSCTYLHLYTHLQACAHMYMHIHTNARTPTHTRKRKDECSWWHCSPTRAACLTRRCYYVGCSCFLVVWLVVLVEWRAVGSWSCSPV